jgi:hypothetical protein
MEVPLADKTVGPSASKVRWRRWAASEAETKVPVAPESRMADRGDGGGTTTALQ